MATTDQGPVEVSQPGEVRVRRALLTVSDKRGLVEFARGLADLGIEIVSTGGTARELGEAGIETRPVEDYNGFPESYDAVLDELGRRDGRLSEPTREALAMEAFGYTARYDAAISRWFSEKEDSLPGLYVRAYEKVLDLSYGENPHQRAAYYSQAGARTDLLSMVSKLHGRELSFNNLLDLDSGRKLLEEFEVPAAAIIKHNNPCGCAVGADASQAFDKALATDRMSAYGGVYCFNRRIDRALAEKLHGIFVELVYAPGYDEDALDVLQEK